MTIPTKLLSSREIKHILSISNTTLWRLIKSKTIPAPIKIGRLNRWVAEEINQYIAGQANQTTKP
ncbi:helix-turn-helix transcriptional regulator [Undibacterium sp. Ji42W]|uniref:helix-turn-helix transcriptional regulator n=1 Tax=Undibacterium sp. Ji42W TaxID=3413039 RepID=UPI003BF445CC